MRKTKIVCTLGPSTDHPGIVKSLILSGMNVARLNFSHGDYDSHRSRFNMVKECREELKRPIATMLDTRGPEVRVGCFENGKIEVKNGDHFTLTTRDVSGTNKAVSVTYPGLPNDVQVGTRILIDDGLIELLCESVTDTDIKCVVKNGGEISDKKSVNVPDVNLSLPYMNEQDAQDIRFGAALGFDFIAASFTRCADDIAEIRQILAEEKRENVRIIAKIENLAGVENIEEIISIADGIMVARGDLGVEIPLEQIPAIQKKLIKKTFLSGKPVITATQMLESMMKNPRPTRAEATDIANAIYDGTSAIMLSGETAAGLYPIEALQTMVRIAESTEDDINYRNKFEKNSEVKDEVPSVTDAISHATCTTAYDLLAKAIITVTKSGSTARMISKYRPSMPIIGCTPDEYGYRQLALTWGVEPVKVKSMTNSEDLLEHAAKVSQEAGYIDNGDLVVITAGLPLGVSGTTNLLRVHIVGDVLVNGKGIGSGVVCGNLCVGETLKDIQKTFKDGDIIVTNATSNDYLPLIRRCSGLVVEQGGTSSHAAVVGLALGIPVLVGANGATKILKSQITVTLDVDKGIVRSDQ